MKSILTTLAFFILCPLYVKAQDMPNKDSEKLTFFVQSKMGDKLEHSSNLTSGAYEAKNGSKDGEYELSGTSELEIRVDAGMKISVIGNNSSKLAYKYHFEGNDQAYEHYFENFTPEFKKEGGRALLNIDFPELKGENKELKVDKHSLEISLPNELLLRLRSRYSQIEVENINLGLEVENRSGTVKVKDLYQNVRIYNEYGSIVASNIKGELLIANRSANVDIRNIVGSVRADAQYSKMNISNIDGNIDIKNRSGIVNAFDIRGSLKAVGDYMEYELTNFDGDIQITNKSGKITVNSARSLRSDGDYTHIYASNITEEYNSVLIQGRSANIDLKSIEGDVRITGEYLNIDLEKINGEANLNNRSGKIFINELEKDLTFSGEYVPITAKGLRGRNLYIENRSGNIDLETLSTLDNVFISSRYGDIQLSLKSPFQGNINVETKFGSFDSNFSISEKEIIESNNKRKVTGVIGNGNAKMEIITENTNVTIKQQ